MRQGRGKDRERSALVRRKKGGRGEIWRKMRAVAERSKGKSRVLC